MSLRGMSRRRSFWFHFCLKSCRHFSAITFEKSHYIFTASLVTSLIHFQAKLFVNILCAQNKRHGVRKREREKVEIWGMGNLRERMTHTVNERESHYERWRVWERQGKKRGSQRETEIERDKQKEIHGKTKRNIYIYKSREREKR